MTTTTPADTPPSTASARRRRTRYLVDPRFQLKYTAMLVGTVAVVMLALGVVIWRTASVAARQARQASEQAEKALQESQTNSQLVLMNQLAAADNPDLVASLSHEMAEVDRAAVANLAEVRAQRAQIEPQRRRLLELLVGAGLFLVVVLSAMGVFITHRIVGPVFKLKRLLRKVGTGRLAVRERLRKGDELDELFDTFLQMTYSLRAIQRDWVASIDEVLVDAPPPVAERLRALREQMSRGLGQGEHERPSLVASLPPRDDDRGSVV